MENFIARIAVTLLTILGIAFVGTMGYTSYSNQKVLTMSTDVNNLIIGARGSFSQGSTGYVNFTTANATALNNAGVLPKNMVKPAGIMDGWGNPVLLGSANGGTMGTIQFGGGGSQTSRQCAGVLTTVSDYVSMTAGGQTFDQSSPPDAVSAGTACANNPTISIVFQ